LFSGLRNRIPRAATQLYDSQISQRIIILHWTIRCSTGLQHRSVFKVFLW
jgi:hypothetical protein